jgi:peptidoglycan hydrolase-like protein with peptidoglycan-binding domain
MPIAHSVGKNGRNVRQQVRCVQALLNVWLEKSKRAALKLDAIAGPKTIAAVEDFQRANHIHPVDGRVDPHGRTIRKLEEQIAPLSQELRAYLTLAMVLSADFTGEDPRLSPPEFLAMAKSMLSRQG